MPKRLTRREQHAVVRLAGSERYDELMEIQGGVCPCGQGAYARRFNVDHDHATMEVRGLLCWRCNYLTGQRWGITPDLLRRIADYLDDPPARRLDPPIVVSFE